MFVRIGEYHDRRKPTKQISKIDSGSAQHFLKRATILLYWPFDHIVPAFLSFRHAHSFWRFGGLVFIFFKYF